MKSSLKFLAIKRCERTKFGKVIKQSRSSKLRWAHTCAHSHIPVNNLPAIDAHERQRFNELRGTVVSRRIFIRSQSLIAR